MREALGQGQSQARVRLSDAVATPHAYGIGALENLNGEVTIDDGQVWLARADADAVRYDTPRSSSDSATLLTLFYVPAWVDIAVADPVDAEQLDAFIRSAAERSGLDPAKPFPFVVRGPLTVKGHVINGFCPMGGERDGRPSHAPYRFTAQEREGLAVGVYAKNETGVMTHHDSAIHVHVAFPGDDPLSGHADSLAIGSGAVLQLPLPPR